MMAKLADTSLIADRIVDALRDQVINTLRRRGLVIVMSGGVDSSVCAALAARALSPRHVFGLMMPERDSDPESLERAEGWARKLGIDYVVTDITPSLEACGCYAARDAAIRRLVPEFTSAWRCKIVLPTQPLEADPLNLSGLAVQPPGGQVRRVHMRPVEYREIVAATHFKLRLRKMLEYYHADRLHFAVLGTPNHLENDHAFFVKGGDGPAEVKPIAHLHESQVYELAAHLRVPGAVTSRPLLVEPIPQVMRSRAPDHP